jgi:ELWxxDGT repeat protein
MAMITNNLIRKITGGWLFTLLLSCTTAFAQPVLVKDIYTGANASIPQNLISINGTLFFTATDGVNGKELWKSDGTDAGTVLVKDIRPGSFWFRSIRVY